MQICNFNIHHSNHNQRTRVNVKWGRNLRDYALRMCYNHLSLESFHVKYLIFVKPCKIRANKLQILKSNFMSTFGIIFSDLNKWITYFATHPYFRFSKNHFKILLLLSIMLLFPENNAKIEFRVIFLLNWFAKYAEISSIKCLSYAAVMH